MILTFLKLYVLYLLFLRIVMWFWPLFMTLYGPSNFSSNPVVTCILTYAFERFSGLVGVGFLSSLSMILFEKSSMLNLLSVNFSKGDLLSTLFGFILSASVVSFIFSIQFWLSHFVLKVCFKYLLNISALPFACGL